MIASLVIYAWRIKRAQSIIDNPPDGVIPEPDLGGDKSGLVHAVSGLLGQGKSMYLSKLANENLLAGYNVLINFKWHPQIDRKRVHCTKHASHAGCRRIEAKQFLDGKIKKQQLHEYLGNVMCDDCPICLKPICKGKPTGCDIGVLGRFSSMDDIQFAKHCVVIADELQNLVPATSASKLSAPVRYGFSKNRHFHRAIIFGTQRFHRVDKQLRELTHWVSECEQPHPGQFLVRTYDAGYEDRVYETVRPGGTNRSALLRELPFFGSYFVPKNGQDRIYPKKVEKYLFDWNIATSYDTHDVLDIDPEMQGAEKLFPYLIFYKDLLYTPGIFYPRFNVQQVMEWNRANADPAELVHHIQTYREAYKKYYPSFFDAFYEGLA